MLSSAEDFGGGTKPARGRGAEGQAGSDVQVPSRAAVLAAFLGDQLEPPCART